MVWSQMPLKGVLPLTSTLRINSFKIDWAGNGILSWAHWEEPSRLRKRSSSFIWMLLNNPNPWWRISQGPLRWLPKERESSVRIENTNWKERMMICQGFEISEGHGCFIDHIKLLFLHIKSWEFISNILIPSPFPLSPMGEGGGEGNSKHLWLGL